MSERESLSSTTSISSKNLNTLSMTGTNIMMSGKQNKNMRSMKHSRSQPELPTVHEMVNVRTKKEAPWGIANYKVPVIGSNLSISRSITMSKKFNNGFIDVAKKLQEGKPSPDTYDVSKKWNKTILGNMKGGKRKTFIAQIFRDEELKPSPGPGTHSPSSRYTKKRNNLGVINKSGRDPFTSDAEFLGTSSPAAQYIDIMKRSLPKPFKYTLKKKNHLWKVDKVDGPDPQSYPLKENAIKNLTVKSSPKWKQGVGKRNFFTDIAQKNSQQKPGAGNYETINYDKIHRRLSSKRQ